MIMALTFKVDIDKNFSEQILKKFLSSSEIAEIVEQAGEVGYNYIYNEIPYKTGQGRSHFIITPARIYPNQTWISLKFDGSIEDFGHLIFLNYCPASDHFHWFENASRQAKKLIKKELTRLAIAKIKSKN